MDTESRAHRECVSGLDMVEDQCDHQPVNECSHVRVHVHNGVPG